MDIKIGLTRGCIEKYIALVDEIFDCGMTVEEAINSDILTDHEKQRIRMVQNVMKNPNINLWLNPPV